MPLSDDEIDAIEKPVDDLGAAAKNVGEGKQDVDQGIDDAQDGDQDTADKASNVGHGGADALREGDEALKDLGILDGNDGTLSNIADRIDSLTEASTLRSPKPLDTTLPKRDTIRSMERGQ